jgi:hypothetical protein
MLFVAFAVAVSSKPEHQFRFWRRRQVLTLPRQMATLLTTETFDAFVVLLLPWLALAFQWYPSFHRGGFHALLVWLGNVGKDEFWSDYYYLVV